MVFGKLKDPLESHAIAKVPEGALQYLGAARDGIHHVSLNFCKLQ